MTYEITLRIRDWAEDPDPQGLTELLAAEFEKFGSVVFLDNRVQILKIQALPEEEPRQMKIGGT